jgi:hypothetical protein
MGCSDSGPDNREKGQHEVQAQWLERRPRLEARGRASGLWRAAYIDEWEESGSGAHNMLVYIILTL